MESLVRPLCPQRASFGRHETFALRYAWLTKGFQALQNNKAIFLSDNATIELGVGKNMVNSIRYWLRATQMIEESDAGLVPTQLGRSVLSDEGWDPYLEDEATLWLIHWLLSSNAELATAWFWFFNRFHKAEFTIDEAANALVDFVNQQLKGKHSERTVRHEINLIIRMYSQTRSTAKVDLEDVLDVPLVSLQLISAGAAPQNFLSRPVRRHTLPLGVIGFAINEVFNSRKVPSLPIADLMYGYKQGVAVGSIFRLTESDLLAKLEQLTELHPKIFQINETAGINQLFRNKEDTDSLSFLRSHYENQEWVNA
jgi:hypothetical protein